ncbi:MAG: T9SS type B sorting domain-containing protein [Flavobacteriaceae bacterium]|nr:T9SS type B sorting domain-containing protein [Flavobacteriaceae bacterium]
MLVDPHKSLWRFVLGIATCLSTWIGIAQTGSAFQERMPSEKQTIRGDIRIISNNILNPNIGTNLSYTGSQNNQDLSMSYIDIDDDNTTFSSSSAQLEIPNNSCTKIVYAALYWGGTYPYEHGTSGPTDTNPPIDSNRLENYKKVKLKIPNGNYIELGPNSPSAFDYTNIYDQGDSPIFSQAPYVNYINITSILQALPNASGTYTIADVVGTTGWISGGSTAGWTMVVVFEDPSLSPKKFSIQDGLFRIDKGHSYTNSLDSFLTKSQGAVNLSLGHGVLDADRSGVGSQVRIKPSANSNFSPINGGIFRSENDFFDSQITQQFNHNNNRTPTNTNSLGWDSSWYSIPNPFNTTISNSETKIDVQYQQLGPQTDAFYLYLQAFAAEIELPKLDLIMEPQDLTGSALGNNILQLGSEMIFRIQFQNTGNEDLQQTKIRLPLSPQAIFVPHGLVLPSGVSHTYDTDKNELLFEIPDNLVETFDPAYDIQVRLKINPNCDVFKEKCGNLIGLQSFASYRGTHNTQMKNDIGSSSSKNNCAVGNPGPSFVQLSLNGCSFSRTELLCGNNITLNAGEGFSTYTWTNSFGNTIGNNSSIVVSNPGTYKVTVTANPPCIGYTEEITVKSSIGITTNPISIYADNMEICPNNGNEMPQIFLCGDNDSRLLNINMRDVQQVEWLKLNANNCSNSLEGKCASIGPTCTYETVGNGQSFQLTEAGAYRVRITLQNNCFGNFFFHVFKNNFSPQITVKDMYCNSPGEISISNLPANYETSLDGTNYSNQNPIQIENIGTYTLRIRSNDGSEDRCDFVYNNIVVQNRNLQLQLFKENVSCGNNNGSIRVHANNAAPQYRYTLKKNNSPISNSGLITDNNFLFDQLSSGDYEIEVQTTDGCVATSTIEIDDNQSLQGFLSHGKSIDCSPGKLEMQAIGGSPPYHYVLKSKNGQSLFNPSNPGTAVDQIQSSSVLQINEPGVYTVMVIDSKQCFIESNAIAIINETEITYNRSHQNPSCKGADSGQIFIELTDSKGYEVDFSIDGGNSYQSSGLFSQLQAGNYTIDIRKRKNGGECFLEETFTLNEAARPLTANVILNRFPSCDSTTGRGEVQVVNVEGGEAPYSYRFGGGSFSNNSSLMLSPGTHIIQVKDALGCVLTKTFDIPTPITVPTYQITQNTHCDGNATIDLQINNKDAYDLHYELDGMAYNPINQREFVNLNPGDHHIVLHYASKSTSETNMLFEENFGQGLSNSHPSITSHLSFEAQATPADRIHAGEYTVTSSIVNNHNGSWQTPNDADGNTNGRFLIIHSPESGSDRSFYTHEINDISPNKEIEIEFAVFNLLTLGSSLSDPDILIELRDTDNNILDSKQTQLIEKNSNWQKYRFTMDPGNHSKVQLKLMSTIPWSLGMAFGLDNILVFQERENCSNSIAIPVSVASNKAFDAQIVEKQSTSCAGDSDGSIVVDVSNWENSTPKQYTYKLNNEAISSPQSTNRLTLENLSTGNHSLKLTSGDGNCNKTINFTITAPNPLKATSSISNPAKCNNFFFATTNTTASGGTSPYQYQLVHSDETEISGFSQQSNPSIDQIPVGNYKIKVTDANNCHAFSEVFTINAPDSIQFQASPINCYLEDNQASISIAVSSGNGNYQYAVDNGPWQTPIPANTTDFSINNLQNGSYKVQLKDQFGCVSDKQTIVIAPALSINTTLTQDLHCDKEALIQLQINGGNFDNNNPSYALAVSKDDGAYQDLGNTNGNSFSFKTNNAGNYRFRVTDTKLCTRESNTVTVTPISPLPAFSSISKTDVLCNGTETGTLNLVIDTSKGLGPYTIRIINNTTATNYGRRTTSLAAGDYTVRITDRKNCSSEEQITIGELEPIVSHAIAQGIQCNAGGQELGSISLAATGGTAPYTYSLTNASLGVDKSFTTSDNNTHLFEDLDFGIYQLSIKDANNCVITEEITITSPPNVLVTTSGSASCNSGQMTVTASTSGNTLGSGPFFFALFPAPEFSASDPAWNQSSGGNSFTFTDLNPGTTYTFVVHDASKNCEFVQEATVPIAASSQLQSNILAVRNTSCKGANDGGLEVLVNPSPGTNSVDYTVITSNGHHNTGLPNGSVPSFSTSFDIGGDIPPGKYYVLFSENGGPQDGCIKASDNFEITEVAEALAWSAGPIERDSGCGSSGSIQVEGQLGMVPYRYLIREESASAPQMSDFDSSNSTGLFENLEKGNYIVYVKDAANCILASDTLVIEEDPSPQISLNLDNPCVSSEGNFEVSISLDTASVGPYLIDINGGSPINVSSFPHTLSNLSSGEQIIRITDQNGCTDSKTIHILPPLQLNSQINKLLSCSSPESANILIAFEGGDSSTNTDNFTISLNGPTGFTAINNLAATNKSMIIEGLHLPGNYNLTLHNNRNGITCNKQIEVSIPPIQTVNPQIDNFTNESCFGTPNDGSISVSVEDLGHGPISFRIVEKDGSTLSSPILPTKQSDFEATFSALEGSNSGINYTIEATASHGCVGRISQAIVEPNVILIPDPTLVEFSCLPNSGNTPVLAEVQIDLSSVSGGSGNYPIVHFEYDNATPGDPSDDIIEESSSPNYNISNLAGGTVQVHVQDNLGCISASKSIQVPPLDQLLGVQKQTTKAYSCVSPGEDIRLEVQTTSADNSKLEYSIDNGQSWQSSNSFNNLAIGNYHMVIRHVDTGCILRIEHQVSDPNQFKVELSDIRPVQCANSATGSIRLLVKDNLYVGDFTYLIRNADTGNPTGVSGNLELDILTTPITLSSGNYTVEIQQEQAPNCKQVRSFQILEPNEGSLDVALAIRSEVNCDNTGGSIEAMGSGGWGNWKYQLKDSNTNTVLHDFSDTNIWSGLAASDYTITIQDREGCERSKDIRLSPPPSLVLDARIFGHQLLCATDNTAFIDVAAIGGSGDYRFELFKNDNSLGSITTSRFSNLGSGKYKIVVTDSWNCTDSKDNLFVIAPTALELTPAIVRSQSCLQDAQIELLASGGTPPYQFSKDNINFDSTTTYDLGPGNYTFYTKDANNCVVASEKVSIGEVLDLSVSIDQTQAVLACFGQETARILANASHGVGNYTYTLLDATTNTTLKGPQIKNSFEALGSGQYKVQVDSGDCRVVSQTVHIQSPSPIIYLPPVIQHVDCHGENNGSIHFKVTGGTGVIKYAKGPLFKKFDDNPVFENLEPGIHEFIIVDSNGCMVSSQRVAIEIKEPEPLEVTIDKIAHESCQGSSDGYISLGVTGGTAPYFVSFDGEPFQTDNFFFNNLRGDRDVQIIVKDSRNCTTQKTVTLEAAVDLSATLNIDYFCKSPGEITNSVTINVAPSLQDQLLYTLDGDPSTTQLSNVFRAVSAGEHQLQITHANGCTNETLSFLIGIPPPKLELILSNHTINTIEAKGIGGAGHYQYSFDGGPYSSENEFLFERSGTYTVGIKDTYNCEIIKEITVEWLDVEMPSYFTPNGDGENEEWGLGNIKGYPDATVEIYDRFGRKIKHFPVSETWDGTFNNLALPSGDYWYLIYLNKESDNRSFFGHFSLIR